MQSLVVYDSKFGNTKRVAEAVADGLRTHGPVRLLELSAILPQELGEPDLLVIGGPTQAHGISARMRQFLDALEARSRSGMVAVTFDTRFRIWSIISGSAAQTIATKLRRRGVRLFAPPESFFVSRGVPQLEEGEAERAVTWAHGVAQKLALSHWCAA